jgi:hypothetical protein
MSVKKQPTQYVSHGKAFDNRAEAERHSDLVAAREHLESAQRNFQQLLAESAKTADGFPFEFGVFSDYHCLVKPCNARPYLRTLIYMCWSWTVRDPVDRPGMVEIREEGALDGRPSVWVPIRELYRNRKAAEAALLAARREWIADETRRLEADENKKENRP